MIEIKIEDNQIREPDRLAAKVSNLEPAMRAIAGVMAEAVEENFARREGHGGIRSVALARGAYWHDQRIDGTV